MKRIFAFTKVDVARQVSAKLDIPMTQAEAATNAVVQTIVDAVANGERVTFHGFGRFEKVYRYPRAGSSPWTQKRIEIPGHHTVKFTVSPNLKNRCNENEPDAAWV